MATRLELNEAQCRELVQRFGTPCYVVDEATFRAKLRQYRAAMESNCAAFELAYASKANSCLAIIRLAYLEGLLIDAASAGEIEAAFRAGVPANRINLHGYNKSDAEIDMALRLGLRQIIVDNLDELARLASRSEAIRQSGVQLALRLAPGVDPITHQAIATGQEDSKFGLNISDGSAERALGIALESGLPLTGFHAHVGSQLLDPDAQTVSARRIAEFAVLAMDTFGFEAKELNLGGGLGIRYTEEDDPLEVEAYVAAVCGAANDVLKPAGLAPTLVQEPGRALIGEAGVTLYTICGAKRVTKADGDARMLLAVDGGMADNPRPALYGAKYSVRAMSSSDQRALTEDETILATIAGRHCETDTLFEDVSIDRHAQLGDYLQVFCTGAYNNSMASAYNRYPRLPMVLIRESGDFELIQRRETIDELFARETIPTDL